MTMVLEDPETPVDPQVDTGGLHEGRFERIERNPPLGDCLPDRPV
jgi:hypothetical protein